MRVVFVHYHLRQGGVGRVILNQMEAIRGKAQVLLLVGEPPAFAFPFACAVVPLIAYDRDRGQSAAPQAIASAIERAVREFWKEGADLYHFHNPTLGKNRGLLGAIELLQARGARMLLQVHDFAEDGRPEGYTADPYPADCHYAVINGRDCRLLLEAGLKAEGLHCLPNPIRPLQPAGAGRTERKLILYPVRAIRRKNIGEALLLSLFIPEGLSLGVTLEPTGSLDRRSCLAWRDLAGRERLRVLFRLGIQRSFESVLGETRCLITTSVKEGFGLAYLEPWTAGRMLHGRLLPQICSDFIDKGLRLDHLYSELRVPIDFIDLAGFRSRWRRCYQRRLARYGLAETDDDGDTAFQEMIRGGSVDFGKLSEDLQKQALVKAVRDPIARRALADRNPFLERMFVGADPQDLIEENRKMVQKEYSLEKAADRLLQAYGEVLDIPVRQSIDKRVLVRAFNTPEQILLLLCEDSYD